MLEDEALPQQAAIVAAGVKTMPGRDLEDLRVSVDVATEVDSAQSQPCIHLLLQFVRSERQFIFSVLTNFRRSLKASRYNRYILQLLHILCMVQIEISVDSLAVE